MAEIDLSDPELHRTDPEPTRNLYTDVRADQLANLDPKKDGRQFSERFIIPAVDIGPENPKGLFPVTYMPGWGESRPRNLTNEVNHLATQLDRRVIAVKHPKRNKLVSAPEGFNLGRPDREYPSAGFNRAIDELNLLNQKHILETNVIAHSQGCIDTVIAALLYPQTFKHLVLVNPAGMVGTESLLSLALHFAPQMPKNSRAQSWEGIRELIENPIRAFNEVRAITQTDIWDALKQIHDNGIHITVIAGADDPVFSPERIQRRMHEFKQENGEIPIDNFLTVSGNEEHPGGHNAIHEDTAYISLAEQALTAYETQLQRHAAASAEGRDEDGQTSL